MMRESFEETKVHVAYLLFFVAAVGFVCSLTYNYGYFWQFDAGVRMLSLDDILKSYSLWLPSLGILFFLYGLDLFLQRIETGKTERKIIKALRHHKSMRWLGQIATWLLLTAIAAILFWYILFGSPHQPLLLWIGGLLLWIHFAKFVFASKLFLKYNSRLLVGLFLFVPVILSFMFVCGLEAALEDTKLNQPNANLYFTDNVEHEYPVIVLRHLEKGLFTKEIDKRNYMLFRWEDISRIEIILQDKEFNGLLHRNAKSYTKST